MKRGLVVWSQEPSDQAMRQIEQWGHTQRAWVGGKAVIGQREKIGTESGSQGCFVVQISHLTYDRLEKQILGKERDSGPRLYRSSKKPAPTSHLG